MKKLQKARVLLQEKELKKSGLNTFQKFKYFELQDFLPRVNEIFESLDLYSHFDLYKEVAKLTIKDNETDEKVQFTSPIQKLEGAKMQDIGATITYAKRYLYMNALEIAENDIIDAKNQEEKKARQALKDANTAKDKEEIIKNINDNVDPVQVTKWLKANGYETLNDVSGEVLATLWKNYLENLKQKKN
ncbi:ERF family protein [Gemella sp. zg-1178]|uniref:ERF family protein n=1 Tax=Gemella sp. zg-1178 TaxID=2840372 RepID=UPI001C053212|nr:ERF family protein [Gemella sp. zg-1178]